MNGEPHVSDQLRERVLMAARELGYRPNSAARILNSGRTRRLGLVTLGTALHGPASLLAAFQSEARLRGYAVSIASTVEGDPRGLAGAIESLLDQGIDGLVISEVVDDGSLDIRVDVPVLALGDFPGITAPVVVIGGVHAEDAARRATQHLLDLGHRTVHHLAGPSSWFTARVRTTGWRNALEAAGAWCPEVVEGDWSAESGYLAGREMQADPSVTAVFAANDDMAIGLIRAFVESGRSVPGSVSVVGYDDVPTAAFLNPPLTTIAAAHGQVAAFGLDQLVRAIEGKPPKKSGRPMPPIPLVVRSTTAPPQDPTHSRPGRSARTGGRAATSKGGAKRTDH